MKKIALKLRRVEKAKARRKDYMKKKNVLRNNVRASRFHIMTAGGGVLPQSRKYRTKKVTASLGSKIKN